VTFVNPPDRLAEQRGDANDLDFRPGGLRHGIGGDDFFDAESLIR
jgi:hypothetical protein